jgi:hypothetical protein
MQALLEMRNLLNDASVCHPLDFLSFQFLQHRESLLFA